MLKHHPHLPTLISNAINLLAIIQIFNNPCTLYKTLLARNQIMNNGKLLHNPRCSKSRQTLALLQEKGIQPEIIEYLKDILTKAELQQIIALLSISAHALLRNTEAEYKTLGLNPQSNESDILNAMLEHPKLIQRPVFIYNNKAAIGRPPENVLDIL